MSKDRAMSLLRDICNGYRALYYNGIVHRDLKPANIFLHNGTAKIGDFGLVRYLENATTVSRKGNILFKAPEVGENPDSHVSDLYAIGMIIARALAGKN